VGLVRSLPVGFQGLPVGREEVEAVLDSFEIAAEQALHLLLNQLPLFPIVGDAKGLRE